MAASSSTQMRSGSPSGWRGSGPPKASSCACGRNCGCGGSCGDTPSICLDDGYSRPKFFAGQLLTEDDLQQLSDYVVAKNRLHARHLFGSGVACGLEVTCDPCGGGKVMVGPGYALDCCGNDIVLSCPQELNIIQMIRDLRRKQNGGVDCGDPCAASTTAQAGQNPANANDSTQTAASSEVTAPDRDKYCLYVNYCEQPSDPVSPYVTDDPCGPQACETTRLREGFRFELRCPDPTEPEPAICRRLKDCLGDTDSRESFRKIAGQLQRRGSEIVAAIRTMQASSGPTVLQQPKFGTDLRQHTIDLANFFPTEGPAKDSAMASPAGAQGLVEATLALASDLALLAIQPTTVQRDRVDELRAELKTARDLLTLAAPKLVHETVQSVFPTALEQAYAASLSSTTLSLLEKTTAWQASDASPQPVVDDLIRLLAYNVAFGRPMQNQMALDTESLRAQLIFRLEQEAMKTRCDLYETVSGARRLRSAEQISLSDASAAGQTSQTLGLAYIELERACLCNALNPPCPTCEDPGVLLACLTVADCKVKDICNLDRQYVLSPVALRYWIPEITYIGRAIEKACCPSPCPDQPPQPITGRASEGQEGKDASRYASGFDYAALIFRFLQSSCAEKGTGRYALGTLDELQKTRLELDKLRADFASLADKLNRLEPHT